jgi:hypothetical protein
MSRTLEDLCLGVAWGHWGALGISASGFLIPVHAVDLEPAIVFASTLRDVDPRLHDEVADWCIQFASHFVSVSVLKHCLNLCDDEQRELFDRFAAIVNKHGGTKWPSSSPAGKLVPSGKSQLRLDRPPTVHLRARKIFGVSARADILVGLSLLPVANEVRWTHVSLLLELGYSKRNLSDALNDLAMGGLLGAMKFGNTIRYALKNRDAVRQLLHPLPETEGQPWMQRLVLASALLLAERRTRNKSRTTQAVEVTKVFERHRASLERNLVPPPQLAGGDPWPQVVEWLAPQLQP